MIKLLHCFMNLLMHYTMILTIKKIEIYQKHLLNQLLIL